MEHKPFKPAWWLQNPHFQTIWPTFLRRKIHSLPLERERFELPDGDFVDLDWAGKNDKGAIVLLLHGLEGSIESPYAKGMLAAIRHQGWRGVFMHFRGCSGEANRRPRSYHSGDTKDLAAVVKALQLREPETPIASVGFSLGGNVLLKWLGETREKNTLTAAVAISVPFELYKAIQRLEMGFSRFYQKKFLKSLREKIHDKFSTMEAPISISALETVKTLREFDNKITAPLHGFKDADDYYRRASSRRFLKHVHIPTLLVQAKDDPFMTEDILPFPHELSSYVTLEVTEKGGHVGFVSGVFPWAPEYWLEQRVPLFLSKYLHNPIYKEAR